MRRRDMIAKSKDSANGLKDGTYKNGTYTEVSVENNTITILKSTANYKNVDFPLKKPVTVHSGDAVKLAVTTIVKVSNRTAVASTLGSMGWFSGSIKFNTDSSTSSKTATGEGTYSYIRMQFVPGHQGAVAVLSMSINGEVVF